MTALDEGWLAFESIKLSSLSAAITVRPGQMHTLAAQVSGQVNDANAGRLFIKYSNGTIVNVWQNTSTFNGSQNVSGSFTTPATVASFQVGTAVTLDKGYLDFSGVTLTAYSAALPITAGDMYQFTGQVAGALAATLGQGGRIVAAYANAAGQSAGEDLLWQNPTNFNGTVPVQQTFTANAGAVTLRLALTAVLDAGHLDFGDFDLQHLTAGDVIRRSTYMLAGQAVAVRISGDPDGNDGLHYLYSDHLGSASAMQKSDGSAPIITRYLPFGGYRGGSGPNEVTDRGFTGQPENMDLGLYYYQARFYVPGIGRFASPDTIVPNPANPQSYNRYSYVLNSPLNFRDPTGHRECGANDNCSDPLPHETIPPRPSQPLPPNPPKILQGLPLHGGGWKTNAYHNGFGANWYAEKYADPGSNSYDHTYENSSGIHPGIDFIAPAGTPVYSVVSGYVVDKFPGDGHPNVVVKVEVDGDIFYVVYGHVTTSLSTGDFVQVGDQVGTIWEYIVTRKDGTTYDNSHLHLAVRQEVRVYNPAYSFIDSSALGGISWSSYADGEGLYSIVSYLYSSDYNYWRDGEQKIGVVRP